METENEAMAHGPYYAAHMTNVAVTFALGHLSLSSSILTTFLQQRTPLRGILVTAAKGTL